jgi:hypothetical protein
MLTEDAGIADGFRRRYQITADPDEGGELLMLQAIGATSFDPDLRHVQPKAVAVHEASEVVDVG